MIKKYFFLLVIPVHANQLDSGVLLVYSTLFCGHSALFRHIPVPFLFIPSHSGVIRFYSRVISPCAGIFRFTPVYSALFVCHSGVISARFGIFRYHSCSFRCHSASFRCIPFRSVPFLCLVTPHLNLTVCIYHKRVFHLS